MSEEMLEALLDLIEVQINEKLSAHFDGDATYEYLEFVDRKEEFIDRYTTDD